jgi:1-aminocyclopropane-1-carboxylate deaminase
VSLALDLRLPSPLVELRDDRLGDVRVLLKRDDLIHPVVGGNKWRKLKYVLSESELAGATTLLTFGGAYSNHVRALAAAGRLLGLRTIGVIRGDERPHNEVLAGAVADGMHLHYVDRDTYRRRRDPAFHDELRGALGAFHLVPEGGTSVPALRGCAEVVSEIDRPFDRIVCPVGTGGTLAGLAIGLHHGQSAVGISVLRGALSLDDEVGGLIEAAVGRPLHNWSIDHRFHHGGFARRSRELDAFVDEFDERHGFRPDQVYVAKMLFGLFAMVAAGEISSGSEVVAVVTGRGDGSGSRSSRHTPDLMV